MTASDHTRTGRTGGASTEPFWHPALFYRGESQYLAGTVPFVREGVRAGEPVAVAVPASRLELLRTALDRELGADLEQVRLLDMARAGRNPGRIIPGVLRAFADRHPRRRVRIIGEPIWPGRSGSEYPACAQHEALINNAFTGRMVSILCPYDADGLPEQVLADAARTHPVLIDTDAGGGTGEGGRPSDRYAPDAVVDTYNLPLPEPDRASVVTFDRDTLGRPRSLAVQHATTAGLPQDRVLDLELAVTELITNSIVHGGGTGTLRLWNDEGFIVCDVRDRGHITDPLAGRRPVDPATPGGRGLLLINHLADLVRVHTTPDGTTIRIYFVL
ncbi:MULTISPECIES: sensor histidine kinase [Actinomadura]|uniref:Anti-sigma factor RsbA family regulatory protein n=1 Tax=Actinomadura yumaensis TaxID=111807 RepID=A0ABW2CNV8_9ACTN|nr:sensor histidine kinase [Actinomadura sp. J1-007]MWK36595.1 sensor histidine kinase [Actinomadura sp. J1-007]